MNTLQALVERQHSFNTVIAKITPNGELVLSLTHSTSDDEEVMVRVGSPEDVLLVDEVLARNPDAWGDDSEILGRLNHGGNWSS